MNNLVAQIEKARPFFEKISRNKYLRAIKDGFIAAMPVVLFSSIFMLLAYVPNIFGFYWNETIESMLIKPYDYTMGILGMLVSGTTAKALTGSFNRDLPKNNQINNTSTMIAAIAGFLLLSADQIEGGLASGYLGTTGLISAFMSAFIVVNIYNLFIKNDITIRMPKEVPPNISQTFKDVLPFSAAILGTYLLDLIVRNFTGTNFAQFVIEIFQPLFTTIDGYLGLMVIAGATAFFWFIGIHGPSIVEPAIITAEYINIDLNLELLQAGEQPVHALTPMMYSFVSNFGGTGATFVVPYMFMFMAKSKQSKAIGRASFIPTTFSVNEPILFGAPLVLNPMFFVPFILTPMVNVVVYKAFIDILGMNAMTYLLPWTTPAPIGIFLSSGFDPLSILLVIVLLIVDVLIYYPFFKVYDNERYEIELNEANEEASQTATEEEEGTPQTEIPYEGSDIITQNNKDMEETNVLVLCAGGGTSGLLANALAEGAEEYNLPINSSGGTYGAHQDIMSDYDLIVLAPQVASNYEDIKKDADKLGVKLVKTEGGEYINLTNDPKGAVDFALDIMNSDN